MDQPVDDDRPGLAAKGPDRCGLGCRANVLVVVRQRIAALVKARRTEAETVAAHPTQEFDARYGAGPVKPDAFVRTVYADLKRK